MDLISFARRVYDLDTIDTRFTSSATVPYKPAGHSKKNSSSTDTSRDLPPQGVPVILDSNGRPIAQPSKWRTPEFYFYYFVFLTVVPYMFWIAYDVSRPSDPNYHKYEPLLSPGWVPGRKIDVSDDQYRSFRENIPYMGLLVILHPLLRRLYESLRPIHTNIEKEKATLNGNGQTHITAAQGENRKEHRVTFDFGFALLFIVALHGFSAAKILLILYANYNLATKIPLQYVPVATWIFNVGVLFANELSGGYRYSTIAEIVNNVLTSSRLEGIEKHQNWGTVLDSYGGIISRWEVLFNITILRLISFNMDYYWSLDRRAGSPIEKKQLDPSNLSERDRITTPANAADYSFRNYVAYALYAPLYLAGPILTFNDYMSQLKYAPLSIDRARTIRYAVRFLLCLLVMELVLHFDYCVAISKANPDWSTYTAAQISLLSFFNLHIVWLKLLLPWRFFRLWALVDGMDPPENMVRCVSDNFSTLSFWRAWHKSFNKWLLRYLYFPLGGSKPQGNYKVAKVIRNYLLTFTFVALWHDIQLNLLIWGWLIVVFMMPEVLAKLLFPRKKWLNNLEAYRMLCGIGVVGNLLMMMTANLVGFAVGVDGLKGIIEGIFRDYTGLVFLAGASSAIFVGIQVMFEVRESEMRRGIFLGC